MTMTKMVRAKMAAVLEISLEKKMSDPYYGYQLPCDHHDPATA